MNNFNNHIGIVENEETYREQIKEFINDKFKLFFWNSAEECLKDKNLENIQLLLLDIALPHMNGIDFLKILKTKYPDIKVLILSGINSDETIFEALKFGACGYIWKNEIKDLLEIVGVILEGGSFMSPAIGIRVLHYFRSKVEDKPDLLTMREKQVLELIISGLKVNKVEERLGISVGTARKHIDNIYNKLQVSNRVELMKKANEMGYF